MTFYNFFMNIGLLLITFELVIANDLTSDLDIIKLPDPVDNYEDETFSCVKFITSLKTSESNFIGYETCTNECWRYKKIVSIVNTDSVHTWNYTCEGIVRDCVQYEDRKIDPSSVNILMTGLIFDQAFKEDPEGLLGNILAVKISSCPVCTCYCDNSEKDRHYVCLDHIKSNVANGYVVTGVRYKIIYNTLTLQIQEGQLVEGIIDSDTLRWIEQDSCSVKGLMDYDDRDILFDDIIVSRGSYVTGASFERDQSHGKFIIRVSATPVDESNNIDRKAGDKDYFPPRNHSRTNVMTADMEIPTIYQNNEELSTPGQSYATLKLPELKLGDETDRLMPYIDIRKVVSNNQPLRGVGIYWRGHGKYGGYIAPKLFVEHLSKHH